MELTDNATDVRKGEELDPKVIEQFLRENLAGLKGPLEIRQFPGGFSNLTYLVKMGDTEMVLRRPPFGTIPKSGHDMAREYRILSAIHPVFPYAPRALVYCDDPAVMGCPFYLMERLHGFILRKHPPAGFYMSPKDARRFSERMVEVLYELHSVDYKAIGLGDLGNPDGYVRRQVEGWNARYRKARTPDVPDCEQIMQWLIEKMPPESDRKGIVHNDFKVDNLLLDPNDLTRITGVLDWEMCTLGDQIVDFGNSVAYWVEQGDPEEVHRMRQNCTTLDGMISRKEMIAYYSKLAGVSLDDFDYYYCFGLFRLLVILQQIYYRSYHGQTQDPRFKVLGFGAAVLERACRRVIDSSDL